MVKRCQMKLHDFWKIKKVEVAGEFSELRRPRTSISWSLRNDLQHAHVVKTVCNVKTQLPIPKNVFQLVSSAGSFLETSR